MFLFLFNQLGPLIPHFVLNMPGLEHERRWEREEERLVANLSRIGIVSHHATTIKYSHLTLSHLFASGHGHRVATHVYLMCGQS